jgi:hypothetical protein
MAIVFYGVASVDFALRSLYKSSSASYDIEKRVRAALIFIQNYAAQAVGHGGITSVQNHGIRIFKNNTYQALLLRMPDQIDDPINWTNNNWVRFRHQFSDGRIIYCDGIFRDVDMIGTPPPALTNSCSGEEYEIFHAGAINEATCSLSVTPGNENLDENCVYYELHLDDGETSGTTPQYYLRVSISALSNPSQAEDSLTNPRVVDTVQVSPPGHTWN